MRTLRRAILSGLLIVAARAAAGEPALVFDGAKAFDLLKKQCAFGPRVPGSAAHAKAGGYLAGQFDAAGLPAIVQRFGARPALLRGKQVTMINILARLGKKDQRSVLISAHWDSRPIADQEAGGAGAPVPAANDGASGAAVVLELARVLTKNPPKSCGIVFALLDGEDMGSKENMKEWCIGSRYLAERLEPAWNVQLAVNVDMVGDASLGYTRETYGMRAAADFEKLCWGAVQAQAPGAAGAGGMRAIFDDHIPFLRAGIPAFDLIDFNYPSWHTTQDTPDKCSAESLQTSGRIVERIVRHLDKIAWGFSVGPLPPELSQY